MRKKSSKKTEYRENPHTFYLNTEGEHRLQVFKQAHPQLGPESAWLRRIVEFYFEVAERYGTDWGGVPLLPVPAKKKRPV